MPVASVQASLQISPGFPNLSEMPRNTKLQDSTDPTNKTTCQWRRGFVVCISSACRPEHHPSLNLSPSFLQVRIYTIVIGGPVAEFVSHLFGGILEKVD